MRLVVILLSLLAAALVAAGCGGSDGTGGGGSTASGTSAEAKAEGGEQGGDSKQGEKEEEGPVVNEEASQGKESAGEAGEGEAGKGGEEGDGSGEAEGPSGGKAALIKAGDEICSRVPENYAQKLQALEKKSGGRKPPTKEANLKAAVPPLYTAIGEFEALSAPSGEEEQLEAMVAALRAAAKGLEEEPESALSGPKSPFAEFQKLTGEYGFQVCSQL